MMVQTFRTLSMAAAALAVAGLAGCAGNADSGATTNPMVGGAPMYPDKTIVANAVNSEDHETLVAAVKQAGLVDTLNGTGPYTVFAPTDDAFAELPEGTVDSLMQAENKEKLQKVLACHVVATEAMSSAIRGMIADDGGRHPVDTVGGCTLTAMQQDGRIMIEDERGRMAEVTIADVDQANGVIHVVDTVLLPAG